MSRFLDVLERLASVAVKGPLVDPIGVGALVCRVGPGVEDLPLRTEPLRGGPCCCCCCRCCLVAARWNREDRDVLRNLCMNSVVCLFGARVLPPKLSVYLIHWIWLLGYFL